MPYNPSQFGRVPKALSAEYDAEEESAPKLRAFNNPLASMCFGLGTRPVPQSTMRTNGRDSASDDNYRMADDFVMLPSSSDTTSERFRERVHVIIRADLLIPGRGDPLEDSALVIKGKLIVWVGASDTLPEEYVKTARKQYSVPYLMPGLWDCHTHFTMLGEEEESWPAFYHYVAAHPTTVGARLVRGCWDSLQWGYTSVRDCAGSGCEMMEPISDRTIVGPNIYSCGGALSQLAGHGDVFSLPAGDLLMNLGVNQPRSGHYGTSSICIVDGVDECRRGVRMQVRRGAKCIKVLASGGVLSSDDNPMYAQFSPEELNVIVEESTRMGRAVAAHVHGKAGILAAVKAGVTTVEHVSFADEECVKLIKDKGVVYVATSLVSRLLLSTGGHGISKKIWEKIKLVAKQHDNAYRLAVSKGCTIALGTDTIPGFPLMAKEIEYAVEAGLSNLQALEAATANGPLTLGEQAPKSGQLKVGYEADMIGVTRNPVEDVKILQDQECIKWVWKGGEIFKGPGVRPWGGD